MNARESLRAIVQRLEAIEKVLATYSASVRSYEESNRVNPQSVRAEITFDDASKREAQTEAKLQNSTQEKIARYAFYAFVAAFFYAGISYLQFSEMRTQTSQVFHQSEVTNANASAENAERFRQLKIAREEAKAAQESAKAVQSQLEITDRPWIKIDISSCSDLGAGNICGGTLTFNSEGSAHLSFTVRLENIGKSVANHIQVRPKIVPIGFEPAELERPMGEQAILCKGPNTYAKTKQRFSDQTIFPHDHSVYSETDNFDTKDIRNELGEAPKPIMLFIVGCVDYGYATSSAKHQTGFIYQIFGSKTHKAIHVGDTVQGDQLTFEPYFLALGGAYAY